MNVVDIIARKRDGHRNTEEELRHIAMGAANASIPDYQLSAWLMAAYLNPLDGQETAWLTRAMADSGARIDLSGLPKPWVDKHSTGGVGDKTTLVLLPMLAACGLTVVKMSGRGLGITGGTVDKLSSIPGFRLDLTPNEMKDQAARIGLALTGQSPDLAPADKALYALRDVTATVGSIPLIVSSILSKKIAGGAETIILDVKCGSGAFMATLEDARRLSGQLVETGRLLGLSVTASISDMAQPLGAMVGNALEVREAVSVLRNDGLPEPSARFQDLCIYYCAEALVACGEANSLEEGRRMAKAALNHGDAFHKFKSWINAQGGADIWNLDQLPKSPVAIEYVYEGPAMYVREIPAVAVGLAVIDLGGGRKRKEDAIDPSVGIELHKCVGSAVADGDIIFTAHARNQSEARNAVEAVSATIEYSSELVPPPSLILT